MYQGEERRQYKRVRKPFLVNFSVREHSGSREAKGWDMVAVVDLGAGGMLFYYNKRMEVGTSLDLKVNFSATRGPVQCTGKVVRLVALPAGDLFLTAVVFSDIKKEDKEALNKAVEVLHDGKK